MLVSTVTAPETALAAAESFASWGLAARGHDGRHTISKIALRAYTTGGDEEEDLAPDRWIPSALVFWVLKDNEIFAQVTVVDTSSGPQVDSMEFVGGKGGLVDAIAVADRIAEGPEQQEMRLVDIPQFNTLLIWITGDDPKFVDRVRGTVYTKDEIANELKRRRDTALRTDPEAGPAAGFRI